MRIISRFIVAIAFCLAGLVSAHADDTPPPPRKSIKSLSPTELMSLRRGVAKMMARNTAPHGGADWKRSWIYWANMHQHFGDDCGGPISGQGMAGVKEFTATDAAETATWCMCEHGTNQFLTWHRMYLWYFERVLQEAAGDTSLRLPLLGLRKRWVAAPGLPRPNLRRRERRHRAEPLAGRRAPAGPQ